MLRNIKKKLKISHLKKVYWFVLKKKCFLILTTKYNTQNYILFPFALNLVKENNLYYLNYFTNNFFKFFYFYNFFLKRIEHLYKPFQKKIFFKGLGFKMKYSDFRKDKLELKLGFSHLITLVIPKKQIKVFLIKKNRLAIEGFNYTLVGNFTEKIRMLRFPDSYNGKGFWYKNEFKTLKQIKKT